MAAFAFLAFFDRYGQGAPEAPPHRYGIGIEGVIGAKSIVSTHARTCENNLKDIECEARKCLLFRRTMHWSQ